MSTTLEVTCTCGKSYRVPSSAVGRKATCKRCGNRFRVGAPAARTPRVEIESPRTPGRPHRTPDQPRRPVGSRSRPAARASRWVAGSVALFLLAAGGITLAVTAPWAKGPLDYIPAEMDFVTQIQVRRSIHALEASDDIEQFVDREMIDQIGIDPVGDIERIYIAAEGAALDQQGEGVLVLIQGNFDRDRILGSEMLQEIELESRRYGGMTYYLVAEKSMPVPGVRSAIAWLESDLVAIGSEVMLRKAIDTGNGDHRSIEEDEEMGELIAQASEESLFWCAVRLPEEVAPVLPEQARSLRSVLIEADHADDVLTLRASGTFAGEKEARAARTAIEEALEAFAGNEVASAADEAIVGKSIEAHGSRLELEVKIDTRKA